MSGSWQPIRTAPTGTVVETAIIDSDGQRNTARLKFCGRWLFEDETMYVYYDPTHWRPA